MITKIDAGELQRWMLERRPFALIDVLTEGCFQARHLPGARNACVYEVTFLDQVRALGLAPDSPIVLYGAGGSESAVAAHKLERAGCTNLFDFAGGREAWEEAGRAFEGQGKPAAPAQPDGACAVDPGQSAIEWIGRNLNSTHSGTLGIAEGELVVRDGRFERGHVVIDMQSIANTDLPDPALRRLLEAHLKSDDFFDTGRFPAARLDIKAATPIPGATPGSPSHVIVAYLTIKDATHPVEFPAIVASVEGALTAVAQLEIDRTRWNVLYGSGRFFRMLGKHLVNDAITLLVKIVAR